MPLFATVQEIADFLQVSIGAGAPTTAATQALTLASAAIQNYTRQNIAQVAAEAITLSVPADKRTILLPEAPVTVVASVVEDGITLVVGADKEYVWTAEGLLRRVGRDWNSGFQKVVVTYTHGYAVIPDDVKAVCIRSAARAYQAGLRSAAVAAVAGINSQQIPDYSVSYQPETGPGSSMLLGASAAPFLLPSEREILDRYRIKP